MQIIYKNQKFVCLDVWFLENIKDFEDRKLFLGKTKSGATIISLIETRTIDGKKFIDTQFGKKALKIIENEKPRVQYTRLEVLSSKRGKPYGWTYGENIEVKNNKGEIISIRQKRCDYFGQKEIINEIRYSSQI